MKPKFKIGDRVRYVGKKRRGYPIPAREYNINSDADFYYDIIDVKWLMDEGIEFVEKHKKYFISYKGKLYGIKQESVNSVLIIREVTCGDLECNSIHFPCMDCPFNKGRKIEIDDIYAKLHAIEY